MKNLPAAVLERLVQGRALQGPSLADNLGQDPTLVVFLRHFG